MNYLNTKDVREGDILRQRIGYTDLLASYEQMYYLNSSILYKVLRISHEVAKIDIKLMDGAWGGRKICNITISNFIPYESKQKKTITIGELL